MIEFFAFTLKGKSHEINEDRIMVEDSVLSQGFKNGNQNNDFISVICDGVGGDNAGEVAADITATSFIGFDLDNCSPQSITQHLHRINDRLVEKQKNSPDQAGMSTTIAGLIIKGQRFLAFNLGDTRIYRFYKGNMDLLSKDHTNASSFVCPDALTSYLGDNGESCFPSLRKGDIEPNTMFLICSDGVYKAIDETEIHRIMYSELSIEQKGRAILRQAYQYGSDDISLVLINCIL